MGAPDNRGTEFIIGYMENIAESINVELFITTMRTTTVNVRVTAPRYSAAGINSAFSVTAGTVKQLFFHPRIRLSGNEMSSKAVWITADEEVVIYGVNKETYSCDAFLGLPTDVLGTEYYAITYYPPSRQCELLVVGVNDSTTVNIRVGDAIGSRYISWGGTNYYSGQTLTVTMNRFDTFQLVTYGDLSGTYVSSSKPVSVFSGNRKTNIGRGGSSDHLVEHLTNVDTWGKRFVTVPVPLRTVGDYFKFIASESNTQVTISGGYSTSFTLSNAGTVVQKTIPSGAYCLVVSDKPILVVQFCLSQQSSSEKSDPMMMIIPPVEQYGADYTFTTPKYSLGSYNNYFMFIVKNSEKSGLRVDGNTFPSNTVYNTISGTDYVGGYISVSEGSHTVRHTSPISIFGGYLYGQANYETYGFTTGMRMAGINTICVPTTTVVGDGIDNDCDGLIDEELCTTENQGRDDDGDGIAEEDCATPPPIDGGWSTWGSYSTCSVSCKSTSGGATTGVSTKTRLCNNPTPKYDGKQCSGSGTQTQSCTPSNYCPVHGGYTSWGGWGACSVTCDSGTQTRTRSCNNPTPQYGGNSCSGSSSEAKSCTKSPCPIDGVWGSWSSYTSCTLTCKDYGTSQTGTKTRTRSCDNPAPQHNGANCPGSNTDVPSCTTSTYCAINGGFTSWTTWSSCSVTCASGTQERSRSCTNPAPQFGGTSCSGATRGTKTCTLSPCPIDGAWTNWGSWSTCTVTCGGGSSTRTRSCTNPSPQYGGVNCPNSASETMDCNTQSCIIDGAWGAWGSWSLCTLTCGGGKQSRSRLCDDPRPQNGGLTCSGDSGDLADCNSNSCPAAAAGVYQQLCPTGWFTCESGAMKCINREFQCDCFNDCDDGSDETANYAGCSGALIASCESGADGTSRTGILSLVMCAVAALSAMGPKPTRNIGRKRNAAEASLDSTATLQSQAQLTSSSLVPGSTTDNLGLAPDTLALITKTVTAAVMQEIQKTPAQRPDAVTVPAAAAGSATSEAREATVFSAHSLETGANTLSNSLFANFNVNDLPAAKPPQVSCRPLHQKVSPKLKQKIWEDDFMFVAETQEEATAALQQFIFMCSSVGVPIAEEKTFLPCQQMAFVGIMLDSVTSTASLPTDKVEKAATAIHTLLGKAKCTLKDLQSLIARFRTLAPQADQLPTTVPNHLAPANFFQSLNINSFLLSPLSFLSGAPDNRGTEFIIGYMQNIAESINVELFITTMRTTTVNVRVTAPRYSAAGINSAFSVTAGTVKQLFFHPRIRMKGNEMSSKAVWITADDEVVIYGVNKETYSCDAFLGLPTDVLGTEYYAVTYYPPSRQCELMIVAVNDSTSVSITVGEAIGSRYISWGGRNYKKGNTLTVTMNRFDTFQLVTYGDLTGTYIESSKAVSVFSGNMKTNIGRGGSSDHLVEHLTPVSTWGKRFVTVPVPLRTVGDYFKFIASESNTKVKISGGYSSSFTLNNPGKMVQKTISSKAYCLVESDKPILVVQFCLSQQSSREKSDPMMMIIPPVEQYGADYTFTTPKYSLGSYNNYFMFIIKESEKSGLRVDGNAFPSNTKYNKISGTDYVGGYISVSEGSHTVRHTSPISIFGGYLYGQANYETYGFTTGMRMAGINTICVPTATVVGDGVDNDCDGLIDEELCTVENQRRDDDGDGQVEEDCAKPPPIDGAWASWGSWATCSVSCKSATGGTTSGTTTRTRPCSNPAPKYDGKQCSGSGSQSKTCTPSNYCPVHGGYSSWGGWGACSVTCASGTQTRTRSCNNPTPQYGGNSCSGSSSEAKSCTKSACPIDGNWANWGSWTSCTRTCGGGTKRRSRTCSNPAKAHGGKDCAGSSSQDTSCNTQSCAVHGAWASWGSYGSCSRTCGGGVKKRYRTCTNPAPAHGGNDCPNSNEGSASCNTGACPIDGAWSAWGSYGSCSVTCGGGNKYRSRTCSNPTPQYGGASCGNADTSSATCNTHHCPINGGWASWGSYGACSVTCGGGTKYRERTCTSPTPQYGGASCGNAYSSSTSCNTHHCPIDGAWSSWGSYGSCSVTCGGGIKYRQRTCSNPTPQYGGASCGNADTSSATCNTHHCPIDGVWGSWGSYTSCSLTCKDYGTSQTGTKSRTRSCNNPPPQYNGAACPGSDMSSASCTTSTYCAIHGGFSSWTTWSTCSVTCATGTQERSRTCTNPTPQFGGNACSGDFHQTKGCTLSPCPIDGEWATWGSWSACTVTCGGGISTRTRTCTNPAPQYNGADCPGSDTTTMDCNTQVCIIDGAWGQWGSWSQCTVTCGGGKQSRTRVCDDPMPANGGLPCSGDSSVLGDCNVRSCPAAAAGVYQQLCPTGWFTCESGAMKCINREFQCDCFNDCDDGSDETATYAGCSGALLASCQSGAEDGYVLDTIGAFYGNEYGVNILIKILGTVENLTLWLSEDDNVIVDRSNRDVLETQHDTLTANEDRQCTKSRSVVESYHGRLKQ
ncbi:uncharacterized protein LOC132551155 [Ylistrum balloti]|uniref:uncharacterized protein LOC132551155 n=1 Tax=Ylistrum balloti TaxID=509963 RepID=UPI002905AC21|nr:uncharacterized protein LOC132551155 [Ylistrum balloti]